MANVILDSNIYGFLVKDNDGAQLIQKIINKDSFIVHDFRIIRDELRMAPKEILEVYDRLVKTGTFPDTREIDMLAKEYFEEYKSLGGVKNFKAILNDFKIVAYASIKNCDIVFSADEKTLKHPYAINSYKLVNLRKNLRTPSFYTYHLLKRSFF